MAGQWVVGATDVRKRSDLVTHDCLHCTDLRNEQQQNNCNSLLASEFPLALINVQLALNVSSRVHCTAACPETADGLNAFEEDPHRVRNIFNYFDKSVLVSSQK